MISCKNKKQLSSGNVKEKRKLLKNGIIQIYTYILLLPNIKCINYFRLFKMKLFQF